ncbi:glucose-6-phosphate isomerase [Candidatus Micrarchaeota archaeon]|nr:glucose-6-phosphate isomerase [Candidatus Micrarchaeota archaeon]
MSMLFYEKPFRLELIGRILHKEGEELEYSTRSVSQLSDVLMEPKKSGPEGIAYYMFRDVYKQGSLRYDITEVPARMFGTEFVKTYGHYHPEAREGLSYPEIYQILNGEAVFIMQKPRRDDSLDCIITRCKKGEVVFVPPDYGHVMVNPSASSTLVSANVVSSSFSSLYEEYRENHGAAYYYTKEGLVQNLNCIIRETKELSSTELLNRYNLFVSDLLEEITQRPEKLEFLEDPTLL